MLGFSVIFRRLVKKALDKISELRLASVTFIYIAEKS